MDNRKKTFIIIACVISIICALMLLFGSVVMFLSKSLVTVDYVTELLGQEAANYTEADIETFASLTSAILSAMGYYCLAMGLLNLVLSIVLLARSNKVKGQTGLLIGLLIVSLLSTNILSLIFVIIAMCIKTKTHDEAVQELMTSSVSYDQGDDSADNNNSI